MPRPAQRKRGAAPAGATPRGRCPHGCWWFWVKWIPGRAEPALRASAARRRVRQVGRTAAGAGLAGQSAAAGGRLHRSAAGGVQRSRTAAGDAPPCESRGQPERSGWRSGCASDESLWCPRRGCSRRDSTVSSMRVFVCRADDAASVTVATQALLQNDDGPPAALPKETARGPSYDALRRYFFLMAVDVFQLLLKPVASVAAIVRDSVPLRRLSAERADFDSTISSDFTPAPVTVTFGKP